jgi:ATP-dependent Clp protease ATP-binding subunit ClpC
LGPRATGFDGCSKHAGSPALARGDIQVWGNDPDEYRQHIEKTVLLNAVSKRYGEPLLRRKRLRSHNIKERYEDHHNVVYTPKRFRLV